MFERPTRSTPETLQVLLDGQPVKLPIQRRSLGAIRTYLETLALENQRVLCALSVDGRPAKMSHSNRQNLAFSRVEGETIDLRDMPLRMLETALKEISNARTQVEKTVTLVLINDGAVARELWWELVRKLKEPLLTLSLLPETIYQPAAGCASLQQMRKWQLEQLATIIKDVDEACYLPNTATLSNALENRAMPWLDKLHQMIQLWHQTVLAGTRLQMTAQHD